MLLQAPLQEHLCVVTDDIRLTLFVNWCNCLSAEVLDLIGAEKDTLAEEVGQDVKCADELHAPVESVKNVCLLGDKLLVCEGHSNVLKQLLYAWVSHLVVLGRDENASRRNQGHNLVVLLSAEMRNSHDMLVDV